MGVTKINIGFGKENGLRSLLYSGNSLAILNVLILSGLKFFTVKWIAVFFTLIFYSLSSEAQFLNWTDKIEGAQSIELYNDAAGNVYCMGLAKGGTLSTSSGFSFQTGNGHGDIVFCLKYDPSGKLIDDIIIQMSSLMGALSFAVSPSGEIYIATCYTGIIDFGPGSGNAPRDTVQSTRGLVVKYDNNGNYEWLRLFKAHTFSSSLECEDLAVDNNNDLICRGYVQGSVFLDTLPNAIIVTDSNRFGTTAIQFKLDRQAKLLWYKGIPGANSYYWNHVDANGFSYTGTGSNVAISLDTSKLSLPKSKGGILQYDSHANLLNVFGSYETGSSWYDGAFVTKIDVVDDSLFLYGEYRGSMKALNATQDSLYSPLSKGYVNFTYAIHLPSNNSQLRNDNRGYYIGQSEGYWRLRDRAASVQTGLDSIGKPVFQTKPAISLMLHSAAGVPNGPFVFGGNGITKQVDAMMQKNGAFVLCGEFENSVYPEPWAQNQIPITQASGKAHFVASYKFNALNTNILSHALNIKVYPNPSRYNRVELLLPKNNVTYQIDVMSINGKSIYSDKLSNASRISLPLGANSGVYILRVIGNNGETATRKIVKL